MAATTSRTSSCEGHALRHLRVRWMLQSHSLHHLILMRSTKAFLANGSPVTALRRRRVGIASAIALFVDAAKMKHSVHVLTPYSMSSVSPKEDTGFVFL